MVPGLAVCLGLVDAILAASVVLDDTRRKAYGCRDVVGKADVGDPGIGRGIVGVGHHEEDVVELVSVIVDAPAPELDVETESMQGRSVEKVELVAYAAAPATHDLVEKPRLAQVQGNLAREDVEVLEGDRLEVGPLHHADARDIAHGLFGKADAIEVRDELLPVQRISSVIVNSISKGQRHKPLT